MPTSLHSLERDAFPLLHGTSNVAVHQPVLKRLSFWPPKALDPSFSADERHGSVGVAAHYQDSPIRCLFEKLWEDERNVSLFVPVRPVWRVRRPFPVIMVLRVQRFDHCWLVHVNRRLL